MGDKITLTLQTRDVRGKKVSKLRRQGFVPGVVYGPGFDPVAIQIESGVLDKTFRAAGKHHPIHITVDGKMRIAMIKDVEHEPV